MAYKDYVQIYNVMDSAGITIDDDRVTQITKIADWINSNFGDIVTADTESDKRVRVLDNKVRAGFGWGGKNAETENFGYKYISSSSTDYTRLNSYTQDYPIETLGLFICRSGENFVMDFINLSSTDYYSTQPYFIHFTASMDDETKHICMLAYDTSSARALSWYTIAENTIATSYTKGDNSGLNGYNNYGLGKTLLTKFTPPYFNLIADDLYKIYGIIPDTREIFELNGQKYLSLKYAQNNTKNNYNYAGFALKLD